jgi:pilus assembly protein CpaB
LCSSSLSRPGIAAAARGAVKKPRSAGPSRRWKNRRAIASDDIGLGHAVAAGDLRWQTGGRGRARHPQSERPDAINQLPPSRASFSGDRSGKKLIKGNGSGYMAAILPSGMRDLD